MPNNEDSRFDLDLKFGQHVEDELLRALEGTIEVKAERDIWASTGNIAIEYRSRGKPSGLSVTEADHWAQALTIKGEVFCYLVFPTERLKNIARPYVKRGNVTKGGDDNTSQMVMIPLRDIFMGRREL